MPKRKRIQEEKLPAPTFYRKLPKAYRDITTKDDVSVMLREGNTNENAESLLASIVSAKEWENVSLIDKAFLIVNLQLRSIEVQKLIELRKQTALLEEIRSNSTYPTVETLVKIAKNPKLLQAATGFVDALESSKRREAR